MAKSRNVYLTGKELEYIAEAIESRHLSGDGPFSKRCSLWLEKNVGGLKALLTHSATAALEMTAILADIQENDEIIMPSFTFVSTANAFVLRGGKPVFVDVRPDTLNIDEDLIEAAITPKTKAIVVVHYAGVGCNMDKIMDIAARHNLLVIEDAAHGLLAKYKGKNLGTLGHFGVFSFHETKNIVSGEGGALIINDPRFIERAEIIREKGTNRSLFLKGEVDKYTWVDLGSSYLPSELIAAFLYAQLESAQAITDLRLSIWNQYHTLLKHYEDMNVLTRPYIPKECQHNAHIYYFLLKHQTLRNELLALSQTTDFPFISHYVSLHSSPAGIHYASQYGNLTHTEYASDHLLRLPILFDSDQRNRFVKEQLETNLKQWLSEVHVT